MELLDDDFIESKAPARLRGIDVRIAHWMIDHIAGSLLTYIALLLLDQALGGIDPFNKGGVMLPATYLAVRWLYYFTAEQLTGRTLGKMLTGARVLSSNGLKPSATQMVVRTSLRFIPFYPLWFILGLNWHDRLADCAVFSQ